MRRVHSIYDVIDIIGNAFIGCGNLESRHQWFPPQGRKNVSFARNKDQFYRLNIVVFCCIVYILIK